MSTSANNIGNVSHHASAATAAPARRPVAMDLNAAGASRTVQNPPCDAALAGLHLLRECRALLAGLPSSLYAAPSKVLPAGTIGKHVRHVLDHFRALRLAADTHFAQPADYDHRERDTPVETSTAAAIATIDDLLSWISAISSAEAPRLITVRVMLAADGRTADLSTSLGRELAFAAHHGEHHHAMIGAICREHAHPVPADWGKAPSTLNHERQGPPAHDYR